MGPLYETLGLTAGWIAETSSPEERRAAYACDVTYGAVSELGFDVLRDRLRTDPAELVVPAPEVALVDEADSVLVDEARVPLVLVARPTPARRCPRWRRSYGGCRAATTTRSTRRGAASSSPPRAPTRSRRPSGSISTSIPAS